jgi:hypothetical protein
MQNDNLKHYERKDVRFFTPSLPPRHTLTNTLRCLTLSLTGITFLNSLLNHTSLSQHGDAAWLG